MDNTEKIKSTWPFWVAFIFIVGWTVVLFCFSPKELVETMGAGNSYLMAFLISVVGAFSSFTTFSAYPAVIPPAVPVWVVRYFYHGNYVFLVDECHGCLDAPIWCWTAGAMPSARLVDWQASIPAPAFLMRPLTVPWCTSILRLKGKYLELDNLIREVNR